MNTAKLNYQDFIGQLKEMLYYMVPEDVKLDVYPVLKNNSRHLDGLVLHQEGSKMSPNFYLQEYYEQYVAGRPISGLAEDIMNRWNNREQDLPVELAGMEFDRCRNGIIYRLVNAGKNQELLEEIPYIPFQDLAITFYYLVSQNRDGIRCIRITNDFMKYWGVNTRILAECAGRNTPRLFPACCNPMSRMIAKMIFRSGGATDSFQGCPSDEPYILTNHSGINGATVWLYPNMMEELAGYFGRNLYILPSSIHELLIVPDDGRFSRTEMLHMVGQVNRECVLPEEILSDNIYFYDRKDRIVRTIGETE